MCEERKMGRTDWKTNKGLDGEKEMGLIKECLRTVSRHFDSVMKAYARDRFKVLQRLEKQ